MHPPACGPSPLAAGRKVFRKGAAAAPCASGLPVDRARAPTPLGTGPPRPHPVRSGFRSGLNLATSLVSPRDVRPARPLEWAQGTIVPTNAHPPQLRIQGQDHCRDADGGSPQMLMGRSGLGRSISGCLLNAGSCIQTVCCY